MKKYTWLAVILLLLNQSVCFAELKETIKKIKPAVVGIGLYTPTGQPKSVLMGSGFAVADGLHIVTNHHVIPAELDQEKLQQIAVFIGTGPTAEVRFAKLIDSSKRDDLALLEIKGTPLPTMKLASSKTLEEGQEIAFTGFPIGSVLGLYPVTHRGIISTVTPIVVPVADSRQISIQMLKQLRDPYFVYQLDATAYPGNSGSAMYLPASGKVVGIINKVFVQQTKEAVIEKPSGITYAIPVKHLRIMLKKNNLLQ